MHQARWQCVALDLDGTLVDSLPALRRAYEAFLNEFGRAGSDPEFDRLNGPNMSTIVALLKQWQVLEGPQEALLARYYDHIARAYGVGVRPAAGADDLLLALREVGYRLALVTSSPRAAVDGVLDQTGWRRFFEVTVCGDEVAEAKPDPGVYRRACELGAWEAASCIAVEDAPAGVQAAAACGMTVVAVGPIERHPALRDHGAVWTCRSLVEVKELLLRPIKPDGIRG